MARQISRLHDGLNGDEDARTMDTEGMAAIGEMPARDREFESLLQRAAAFQDVDTGCKLRGEAN
jgi:hypothetical protein